MASDILQDYVYHPLGTGAGAVRLMKLHLGNYDDNLSASIIYATLPPMTEKCKNI